MFNFNNPVTLKTGLARRTTSIVALAQEKTRLVNELESTVGKKNVHRVAKHMGISRQDVVGVNCMKICKWKSVSRK